MDCGVCKTLQGPAAVAPLWEDDTWHVRPADPAGVPGWMLLLTKRHCPGPAHFSEREAREFGLVLHHLEAVLERVTGALRIYTAAMGESHPHFHAHMVPRYAAMPRDAKGWSVFDLQRAVGAGEVVLDQAENARIANAYQQALRDVPAPWHAR